MRHRGFSLWAVVLSHGARAFIGIPRRTPTTSTRLQSSRYGDLSRESTRPAFVSFSDIADPPMGGQSSMTNAANGGSQRDQVTQGLAADAASDAIAASFRTRRILDATRPISVQGGSLKTWTLQTTSIERVQLVMTTEGRPLDADIDLWHGPDNTPMKMRVYVEDGTVRPFSAVMETPKGPNTVAVRNIGALEFPLSAYVIPNPPGDAHPIPQGAVVTEPRVIQGGALRTYPFDANVKSVQVLLRTDGRPLNARIELLQGPNNIKQVVELYIEDGALRPFFAIFETPGIGNVIRMVNTATIEFPLSAWVQPYLVDEEMPANGRPEDLIVIGGTGRFGEWRR